MTNNWREFQENKSVKLKNPPSRGIITVYIHENGSILVDDFDYSGSFGNDVAWDLTVAPEYKIRIVQLLGNQSPGQIEDEIDFTLLMAMELNFGNRSVFKEWLEAKQIPFNEKFDFWA
ncbi:hypothetical protein B1R32_101176 [Abditibacterium utsteinense]|uniref:Uncharacterized protein n=1 Tax=Abditibacterium utsteinense TaxID=1960156 RepID=A0A2S8SXB6_9BACT|nr:hypothetical protein [Abditibacterium utsteinense]PQV65434.1 hypothetical protein B1R32_101176 [Abditibacterium utsteinense]